MVFSTNVALLAVGLVAAASSVHGHGYMLYPYPYFPAGGDITTFAATIDGPSALTCPSNGSFTSSPSINSASFTEAFNSQTTYKTLKALIEGKATVVTSAATLTCGYTDPDNQATADDLPAYVTWTHSSTEGFTASHEGPCEVWCDSTRVFQNDNCPVNYPSAPALLPYDQAVCKESSKLTFYWLALHSSTWQVYINCAKLSGDVTSTASSTYTGSTYTDSSASTTTTTSSASAASTTTSASTASSASSASAETTTSTSTADEATDSASATDEYSASATDEYSASSTTEETTSPATTTATPSTTTATPTTTESSGSSKCNVRRSRRN